MKIFHVSWGALRTGDTEELDRMIRRYRWAGRLTPVIAAGLAAWATWGTTRGDLRLLSHPVVLRDALVPLSVLVAASLCWYLHWRVQARATYVLRLLAGAPRREPPGGDDNPMWMPTVLVPQRARPAAEALVLAICDGRTALRCVRDFSIVGALALLVAALQDIPTTPWMSHSSFSMFVVAGGTGVGMLLRSCSEMVDLNTTRAPLIPAVLLGVLVREDRKPGGLEPRGWGVLDTNAIMPWLNLWHLGRLGHEIPMTAVPAPLTDPPRWSEPPFVEATENPATDAPAS